MAIIERKTSYGVRIHKGGGKFEWVGSFPFEKHGGKRKAKDAAEEAERGARKSRFTPRQAETCDSFAKRWLDEYTIVKQGPTRGRRKSQKTLTTYRQELQVFIEEFKGRALKSLDRQDARRFASAHPRSAVVVRGMLSDALDDQLVAANVFQDLRLEESPGRRHHAPITEAELKALADTALTVHGDKYGPVYRSFILFTAYVGCRLEEGMNVEWRDINPAEQEVTLRVTKFDKPRTVLLRPEAIAALNAMPRRMDIPEVFYGKRGGAITKGNHQAIWTPIRATWWASLSPERRDQIAPTQGDKEQIKGFVWHSLRHFTGHWLYITLGLGSELAAFQLGHSDPSLIERLYGHPFDGALDRLKRATNQPTVASIQDARGALAKENTA